MAMAPLNCENSSQQIASTTSTSTTASTAILTPTTTTTTTPTSINNNNNNNELLLYNCKSDDCSKPGLPRSKSNDSFTTNGSTSTPAPSPTTNGVVLPSPDNPFPTASGPANPPEEGDGPNTNFTHTFLKSILASIDSKDPGGLGTGLVRLPTTTLSQDVQT